MNMQCYSGAQAIADYLRPERDKYIPLVELPQELNPYLSSHTIHISVKLMNTLPLGNVKSLPAWRMLETASDLTGCQLVEASSGNTVMSLGLMARHYGAASVTAIASPDVSDGKLSLLRLAGVKVQFMKGPICPNPNDPDGAIATARRLGDEPGWYNAGQYDNEANPAAHEAITGPQLYDQLGGALGAVCAGLGTSGTLLGTMRYLRTKIPNVQGIGVVRAPNNLVPGVRTVKGLEEVAFDWRSCLNGEPEVVTEKQAYHASLRLIRAGLLVGPSSGFALAGAWQRLAAMGDEDLELLAGKHVVVVCPDSPLPYLADYERVLDATDFPLVHGGELRQSLPSFADAPEITCQELAAKYSNNGIPSDTVVIDVREKDEYADHHLENSQNIPLHQIPAWLKHRPDDDGRAVVFVCRTGRRSADATQLARRFGVAAVNLRGGTTEWSVLGLPRATPVMCATAGRAER